MWEGNGGDFAQLVVCNSWRREGEERQPAELVRMFIVQCEGSVIFYRELAPTI